MSDCVETIVLFCVMRVWVGPILLGWLHCPTAGAMREQTTHEFWGTACLSQVLLVRKINSDGTVVDKYLMQGTFVLFVMFRVGESSFLILSVM